MNYHPLLEKQLSYFKHMRKQLEARETMAALYITRRKWLQRQKVRNYQIEHDRVRNILANTNVKDPVKSHLKNREDELKQLGARAISGIVD